MAHHESVLPAWFAVPPCIDDSYRSDVDDSSYSTESSDIGVDNGAPRQVKVGAWCTYVWSKTTNEWEKMCTYLGSPLKKLNTVGIFGDVQLRSEENVFGRSEEYSKLFWTLPRDALLLTLAIRNFFVLSQVREAGQAARAAHGRGGCG